MAFVGEVFKVNYIASEFKTGLTDVEMIVYKPDGVKQGIYSMQEIDTGDGSGIYYYNYADSDLEGAYLFIVNSVSWPKKDAKQVFFTNRVKTWTDDEKSQIRQALGINGDKLDTVDGNIDAIGELLLEVDNDIKFIRDIESGKWHIIGDQMIFYKEDNETEIARFNLFNDAGIPAMVNIVRRERIS